MLRSIKRTLSEYMNAFFAFVLLTSQLVAPIMVAQPAMAAHGAPVYDCVIDTEGADDEPGQKDLNQLCIDDTHLPDEVDVTWNWDNSGTTGQNTMDACALFDTDGDGKVNYSVCVVTNGDPAVQQVTSPVLYSCGDDKPDRCTSPVNPITITGNTDCEVNNGDGTLAADPFHTDVSDAWAECTLDLSDIVASGDAELVDVCSYPSSQPNSDPSDCVIIKDVTGFIQLFKEVEPDTDTGVFNLSVGADVVAFDVGDGGSSPIVQVDSDNNGEDFTVSEAGGTATSLANYNSSVQCSVEDKNGNVTVGPVVDATSTVVNVAAGEFATCVFTNTAVDFPTVTVIKEVTGELGPNASVDAFGLTQNGAPVASGQTVEYGIGDQVSINEAGLTGYEFVSITGDSCPVALGGSTTALTEGQDVVCTITNDAINPVLRLEKQIDNGNGGNATQDDFTPLVNGSGSIQTEQGAQTVDWDTNYTVAPGGYTVTEQLPLITGYEFVNVQCHETGTMDVVLHPVALGYGDDVTCTVNNDDVAPSITLVKDISRFEYNSPATADQFVLHIDGEGQDGNIDRSTGYSTDVQSNTPYTLSEDPFFGHDLDEIVCVDFAGAPIALTNGNVVTLDEGVDATCTFYNIDLPAKVIVQKLLLDGNADGGTLTVDDFPISFDGELAVMSGGTTGEIAVAAGEYEIVEGASEGYTFVSLGDNSSDACVLVGTNPDGVTTATVTVEVGVTYTCILVNDDIAPTLTLVKEVVNDDGGLVAPEAWTLTANNADDAAPLIDEAGTPDAGSNPPTATTATYDAVAGVPYTLSEDGPSGYEASDWTCEGGSLVGDVVTLSLDEDVVCTITNRDLSPTLTLVKVVVHDDGGDNNANEWNLNAGAYISEPGTSGIDPLVATTGTYSVPANEDIVLSENGPAGYTASDWSCDVDGVLQGDTVNLDLDQDVTCTIENDDIAPVLWVQKNAINDNGGTTHADQFNLYVNGGDPLTNPISGGLIPGVSAATYSYGEITANTDYTITEDTITGYTPSPVACFDFFTQAPVGHPLNIDSGETATCVITNDDQAASLTLVKEVVNDEGGNNAATEWTLTAVSAADGTVIDEQGTDSGNDTATTQTVSVTANSDITLSEDGPGGYTASDWDCEGGTQQGSIVSAAPGENVVCTITNNDQPVELNVTKYVFNNHGGDTHANQFELFVDTTTALVVESSGDGGVPNSTFADQETVYVTANENHTISENVEPGYENTSIACWINGEPGAGNPFTADSGDSVQCNVFNYDLAPTITLIKDVSNDNGGLAEADDWTLYALSNDEELEFNSGDTLDATAGVEYTLDELLSNPEFAGQYDFDRVECDTEDVTNLDQAFTLDLDQDLVCTIFNDDIPPQVTLVKDAITFADFEGASFDFTYQNNDLAPVDVTLDDFSQYGFMYQYRDSYQLPDTLQAGTISFTEIVPEGWNLVYTTCDGLMDDVIVRANGPGMIMVENPISADILPGDEVTCLFQNVELADIIVHKVHDIEEDYDLENDNPLEGWDFTLELPHMGIPIDDVVATDDVDMSFGITETTDEQGIAEFENVFAQPQFLSEDIDSQEGWNFGSAYCEYEFDNLAGTAEVGQPGMQIDLGAGLYVFPLPGETVECWFGNYQDPVLELAKVNDTGGADQSPGDDVVFTITVTNPEGSGVVYDTVVTDVLQPGLDYNDAVTVISSTRGDITALVGDPMYDDDHTGEFNLGDLAVGEVVTITYTGTVGSDTIDGVYPDVAFAQGGCNTGPFGPIFRPVVDDPVVAAVDQCEENGLVLSNVHLPGLENNPFVGTEVSVVTPVDEEVGFVLGVNIVEELVNTGVPAVLPAAIGAIISLIALALTGRGRNTGRKAFAGITGGIKSMLLVAMLSMGIVLGGSQPASAVSSSFCSATLSSPIADVSQDTINLDYQVASTESADTFDVDLVVDGAVEQSLANVPANSGGSFIYMFPAEGSKDFTIEVTNPNCVNDPNASTPTVTVIYDVTDPSSPVYTGAERSGNTYTLNFTAPATDVEKIEIYASTSESFSLSPSNKVGDVAVTPGESKSFVYVAPDSTQRNFALVAIDAAGNQSVVVGDSRTEVVTTFVNDPTQPATDGSSTATGGADVALTSTAAATDGEAEEGAVLGEEDSADGDAQTDGDTTSEEGTTDEEASSEGDEDGDATRGWLVAGAGALLVGGWYLYRQRNAS